MNEEGPSQSRVEELPEIAIEKRRGISVVWLIPLVAAIIGAWLGYKTITDMGPICDAQQSIVGFKHIGIAEKTVVGCNKRQVVFVSKIDLQAIDSVLDCLPMPHQFHIKRAGKQRH